MKKTSLILSFIVLISITSCCSPKDANKDNFKKVINGYLEKNCVIISPRDTKFPVTLELRESGGLFSIKQNLKQNDALVAIGLLKVEEGSALVDKFIMSMSSNPEKITVPTKTYSLTDKGKETFDSSKRGFCVATYQVNEIINFSEPSQSMGYTISRVKYSVSPTNIKEWATEKEITEAFSGLPEKLQKNQEQSAVLVLMNDGWVHEREMR